MSNQTKVKKRDGRIESLDLEKMHIMVAESCKNLAGVSASQVEMKSGIQFYDGITTAEIQEILIRSASDLIDLDHPNYQYVAARLLMFSLRKSLYGQMVELPHLEDHIYDCVSRELYDSEIFTKYSKEEIDKVNSFIDHDRDFIFTYAGLRQVVDKYLVQDRSNGQVYETPQFMYIMIALTIFQKYPKNTRLLYIKKYYDAISKHKINIPTPIMAGVRTPLRQFASCVLVDVDDTMRSIESSDAAIFRYVSQRAGIGINAGRIRGINSKIRGGEVIHTGVVPFLKKFEATVRSCTQNGIRGGSATVHFPIWHQEIEDIIVLKNNKGTEDNRVRKLDYSIQISKLFYERFIQDGEITLFSPHDVPGLYDAFGTDRFDELYVSYERDQSIPRKTVRAQELILDLLKERAETGRIYIMNIDHCNSHSSFKDQITMSNLCVAGDTKIKIRYPESVAPYNHDEQKCNWGIFEVVIDIDTLGFYIEDRDFDIKLCKVSPNEIPQIEVLSYNTETNKEEWKPVTAFAETSPKSKVMKITDEETCKSIVVTPEHKVFTKNRGYVMAKDLVETDELVLTSNEKTSTLIIEYLEEKIPVYDITVEGTHNFFANDILVHNCQEITLPTVPLQHIDQKPNTLKMKVKVKKDKVEDYKKCIQNNGGVLYASLPPGRGTFVSENEIEDTENYEYFYEDVVVDDNPVSIQLCILSAINVGKVKSDEELEELCDLSVRGLDELIDYQKYPVKAAEIATKARRSLGIGYIGLAHYLAKLGFNYDSQEAWDAVHGLSESFQYYLLKASNQLAKEKGYCEYFGRTKYSDGILPIDTYKKDVDEIVENKLQHDWDALRDDILKYGLRHSTLSAQMPSESSSVVSNATNGIEPPRDYLSIKKSKKGPLKQIVPQYSTLKNNYTLLWDIKSNEGYINIVALMQKFFDQAISGNTSYNPENYPNNEVPVSVLAGDLLRAYSVGWKTLYYQNTYDIKTDDFSDKSSEIEKLINDIIKSDEDDCESCKL